MKTLLRNQTYILIICITLFLFQRTSLLLFGYRHIAHPSFDETASGVLAYDLSHGNIRGPLFSYQYENRSGDSLIEGLLLSVFFKYFSNSLLSIKLLSLMSSLACLILWSFLIKKYSNLLSAIIFSLLYALPPPMFARLNLIGTIDSHHFINMLIPLQIIILFLIVSKGDNRFCFYFYLVLGFIMGLGAYMFYSYLIFNAFCAMFLLSFKISTISRRNVLAYFIGLSLGFMPWFLRSFYSPTGGLYLKSILMHTSINLWNLFQNVCFNVPHSLSYEYPSRKIGYFSFLFIAIMLLAIFQIMRKTSCVQYLKNAIHLNSKLPHQSSVDLFCLFIVFCPFFFIACLSFSPMQSAPFEFWPTVGIFATFPPADIFRYRWMHVLFPFYFAIIALGTGIILRTKVTNRISLFCTACLLLLILTVSLVRTVGMCSFDDKWKLLYYRGYNFDQSATRFILSDFKAIDHKKAAEITVEYPNENKGAAYQCLATRLSYELLRGSGMVSPLFQSFYDYSEYYRSNFIYGIVRALLPERDYMHIGFVQFIIKNDPELFFENLGYCYLGYKYYGYLINKDILLKNFTGTEKWFFGGFIDDFSKKVGTDKRHQQQEHLIAEISMIPEPYRSKAVKGLGKLIGAEMLFDPLHVPDYPLDSKVGMTLKEGLQPAFYEGIGAGFAETLHRYWRTLVPPDDILPDVYEHMLDIEWQRCWSLMTEMPSSSHSFIKNGFELELQGRHVNQAIKNYIARKLSAIKM